MRRPTAGAGVALQAASTFHAAAEQAEIFRDLFALSAHEEGATFRQIGAALGMPPSTARDLVYRARRDRDLGDPS